MKYLRRSHTSEKSMDLLVCPLYMIRMLGSMRVIRDFHLPSCNLKIRSVCHSSFVLIGSEGNDYSLTYKQGVTRKLQESKIHVLYPR